MPRHKLPVVGIIMLDTRFPRYLGDIGNPESFSRLNFATIYQRVPAATVATVVTGQGIEQSVADQLLEAAKTLGQASVDLVLTSCGYLGELQQTLQQAAGAPVVASSLLALPLLRLVYGDAASLGVMTFDAQRLKPHHLQLQTIDQSPTQSNPGNIQVRGMESSPAFYKMIANDEPQADFQRLQQEVVLVAESFGNSGIEALVLECTNLSPFKNEIREAAGVPVFDILDVSRFLLRKSDLLSKSV